jgi:hypothetical protein
MCAGLEAQDNIFRSLAISILFLCIAEEYRVRTFWQLIQFGHDSSHWALS